LDKADEDFIAWIFISKDRSINILVSLQNYTAIILGIVQPIFGGILTKVFVRIVSEFGPIYFLFSSYCIW
jgi:hypothetical protein